MKVNTWKMTRSSAALDSSSKALCQQTVDAFLANKTKTFADIELLHEGYLQSLALAESLRGKYQTFCVLGIGGSSLGSQAVLEALCPEALEEKKVLFFDNVDAKSFFRRLQSVKNLDQTLWILVSKSGGTVETLVQAEFIREYLHTQGKSLEKNAVAITELQNSALYDWAKKYEVPCLPVPQTIGGRFSVLTPVGTFLFCLLNIPVQDMLTGASLALQNREQLTDLVTQFAMSLQRGETTSYFFSYCDDLRYFGQWLQQLWAESLGKKVDRDGNAAPPMSLPYACRGATDQHSVLQQIAEGTQKKMTCFLRVHESENSGPLLTDQKLLVSDNLRQKNMGVLLAAEGTAIEQALNEQKIHSLTLETTALTASSMGYLLMTFQLVVATLGLHFRIDPFNQPGVERGKVLTRLNLKK